MSSHHGFLSGILQVETTNRFTSLISKPVHHGANDELTADGNHVAPRSVSTDSASGVVGGSEKTLGVGFQTPVKRPSSGQSTDRHAFHRLFTSTVKSSQLSQSEKLDLTKTTKGLEGISQLDLRRRKSTGHALMLAAQAARAVDAQEAEEAREVYQNNMGDLIWLELQVSVSRVTFCS